MLYNVGKIEVFKSGEEEFVSIIVDYPYREKKVCIRFCQWNGNGLGRHVSPYYRIGKSFEGKRDLHLL